MEVHNNVKKGHVLLTIKYQEFKPEFHASRIMSIGIPNL